SGTGGAFVVHHKVHHGAVFVQPDDLAVLPADVDDGAYAGVQVMGAPGMAGDLGDALVTVLNGRAAVAGGHDGVNVAALQPGLFQGLLQGTFGAHGGTGT